jgi:hypothetical protein
MRQMEIGLVALTVLSCASGGSGGGDEPIPYFPTPSDVPCAYEVIDTVRATGSVSIGFPSQGRGVDSNKDRVLGRAAARAGADAVIGLETPPQRVAAAVPRGETRQITVTYRGGAIRYLDPGCAVALQPCGIVVPGQCETWSQVGVPETMSQGRTEQVQRLMRTLGPEGARVAPTGATNASLQNAEEIRELLRREYPPLLRDAGIAGTVWILLFIAESGRVHLAELAGSSGHRALDEAALTVAP